MLKLKMWTIVRVRWMWTLWILWLMRKYSPALNFTGRLKHARFLWNQYNHGYSPALRFTPLETLNASYFQDAEWEGDHLP